MTVQRPSGSAPPSGQTRRAGLLSFSPLIDYLYCLLASTVLVGQPLPGGALYMTAQVTHLGGQLLHPRMLHHLPRRMRAAGAVLSALSMMVALGLLLIYPRAVNPPYLWVLFGVVVLIKLRQALCRRLNASCIQRGLSRIQRAFRLGEASLLFLLLLAPLLFFSQPTDTSWYLLGGYALTTLIGVYALYHSEPVSRPPVQPAARTEAEDLSGVNALRSFRVISLITVTALQVTMILGYTLIGTTAGDLLICMGIAFVCTYIPMRVAWVLLHSRHIRRRDPTNMLVLGLAVWLISLLALWLSLGRGHMVVAFISLAFCTAGTAMALTSLQSLDGHMREVILFATGRAPDAGEDSLHGMRASYASLAGQMIALIGLGLMLFFGGGRAVDRLNLQPTLLLPALALVIAALLAALRFPLDQRVAQKLHRFLMLKENGETNQPLQKQLEDLVIKVSHRHYGIKLLMLVLRPFFYIRLGSREHVRLDRHTACVFTCNHGELYGPIVTNLYVPYSFRPWVISEMVERDQIADYIYTYTVKRQRWLPEGWKLPISRVLAPFLAWVMESIDSIPVYRNTPRELIKTLRLSAAAMEAGDNLLIFPENPNHEGQAQNGYLRDTVGEFFTGFVTVAQLYHKRTGKCAQFFPLYADKKNRILHFGNPVRYNPDVPPREEQQRISDALRQEMLRMAAIGQGDAAEEGS
ncbi:MAG: hypothetical protein GX653_06050 [Clostridiales bacterium]|nr:hypothetical protein [Clostridiales bacterium]